jgi:hypothetical protein
MSARRRTHPLARAAKSTTATQFVASPTVDQRTYTSLIMPHTADKWGRKLTLPWACPSPAIRLRASREGDHVAAQQPSSGRIRNQFDQLAMGVTAEIDQSACAGDRCPRRVIWSLCYLAPRIPQIQHGCRESSLSPRYRRRGHSTGIVHRWSDGGAMRHSPMLTTVTALTQRGLVCGETSNTRSRRSRACPHLWQQFR